MLILQNIYFSCYMWGHKMKNKKYHTVRTVPKNITLSEQFQKIIETETNLLLIVITICTEIIYLANSTRF